jgi:hypothetical protein
MMKHVKRQNRLERSPSLRSRRSRNGKSSSSDKPQLRIVAVETAEQSISSAAGTPSAELITQVEAGNQQDNPSNDRRVDELNDKQLEIFAQNCWLVSLIENKVPVREALQRLGITRSDRSVRDLMRRYRLHGRSGLFDQRWFRHTESGILTPEVKKLTLGLFF